jgi:predicted lipase
MENKGEKPGETFAREKFEFEQAKKRYRDVIRQIRPLADLNKLSTPPVNRAAYSDRMAWIMAQMAKLAYIPFEESDLGLEQLEYALQSGWFNLMQTFNQAGTQAFLAKNDEFAVLAFRGTQPTKWEDVRTDLRALKQKTVEGKVHKGFQEAFDLVRDEIFDIVDKSIGKDLPLYVTGHSLGAALATVATQELEEKFHDLIAACYTFGSPRVGDGTYEKSIKAPVYRIVNTTDIVTLVPFFLGTFMHVGDPRYLSRRKVDNVYRIYKGIPFVRRTFEAIIEMILPIFHLRNPLAPWVTAHSMDFYIEKLENYAMSRNTVIKEKK